jgi:hypothetical protein
MKVRMEPSVVLYKYMQSWKKDPGVEEINVRGVPRRKSIQVSGS